MLRNGRTKAHTTMEGMDETRMVCDFDYCCFNSSLESTICLTFNLKINQL